MVRMGGGDQAKWLIDNLSGNVPQGLQTTGPIMIKAANPMGSGWGKGFGKGWMPYPMMMMLMKGKGKGKGWGFGLSDFPAEKKVWVGGLPESVTYEELRAHFSSIGSTPKFAMAMKGKGAGTGGVAFATAEEATTAIQMLNGSVLGGATIQVDVWTKKEPAPAEA